MLQTGERVLSGLASVRERAWSCTDDEIVDATVLAARTLAAARATYLAVLAQAVSRAGAAPVVAAVAGRTTLSGGRVLGDVEQAQALGTDGPLPGVGAALAAGTTTAEHAALAVRALASIPARMVRERAAELDALLTSHATTFTAPVFPRLARHLLHTLDPDRADRFDPDAHQRREAHLGIDSTGMGQLRAQLDPHATATLKAVLDALSAPTPSQDGVPDARTAAQRRADALHEMARAAAGNLPAGDGPGYGDAARIVLHVGPGDTCDTAPGFVSCEQTGPFSAPGLGVAACDATAEIITMAASGRILSMATTGRFFTGPQRRALAARDGGCAFPGCDRPPGWTQAHHTTPWSHGGTTDTDHGVLLCLPHHTEIHHGRWSVTVHDGVPWFVPPPETDPTGTGVRNTVHDAIRTTVQLGRTLRRDHARAG